MRIPLIERVAGKPVNRTAALVVSRGVHYDETAALPFHPLNQTAPPWLKDICGRRFGKLLVEGPHVPLKRPAIGNYSLNLIVLCDCGRYELRTKEALERYDGSARTQVARMCFYCAHPDARLVDATTQ